MPSSQADWDAKHRLAAEALPSEPASIVRELLSLLPAGPALDIACGTGRHALLLAERGQHVTARKCAHATHASQCGAARASTRLCGLFAAGSS